MTDAESGWRDFFKEKRFANYDKPDIGKNNFEGVAFKINPIYFFCNYR